MAYLKGVLATVAAFFLGALAPTLWWLFRSMSTEKATGLTAVAGGLCESILSPWFWILVLLFSIFFYFSARFENKPLRLLLFWIPAIASSFVGFGFWALFEFLALRFPRG